MPQNKRVLAGVIATMVIGIVVIAAGAAWFGLGLGWFGKPAQQATQPGTGMSAAETGGVTQDDSGRQVLYWYDPMVPQHRFEKPGKSPFMDMQLVPKYADEVTEGGVTISPQTQQSLGIRTAPAVAERFTDTVRAIGEIKADERGIEMVHNRVNGFIEKLWLRAEGEPVQQGQKLAEVYAPDLLAAQEELLALVKLESLDGIEQLRDAARARLRLLGMTSAEIKTVEQAGEAAVRIGIYAPRDGIVQRLGVREGAAVQPGGTLFEILDLSKVWLTLEVPERQLGQLDTAGKVEVSVPAYPGERFYGEIDYIYPTVSSTTRTVPVRVVLDNPRLRLKPGMYAEAEIVIGEHQGLWVLSEAVIATGERSLVIVKTGQGFRPARVDIGLQRGNKTEILRGLKAGEEVVVSGQFLIDSEASLSGVLARLNPPPKTEPMSEAEPENTPAGLHEAELHEAEGTVEKYDMDTGLVTLSHGPIPSMNWPPMTMPFKLSDPHALHGVAPGTQVKFKMRGKAENGYYVIKEIEVLGGGQ